MAGNEVIKDFVQIVVGLPVVTPNKPRLRE